MCLLFFIGIGIGVSICKDFLYVYLCCSLDFCLSLSSE